MENIVLENELFRLELSPDGQAESLLCKENGTQCLFAQGQLPFFSLTEERPYHNELKLAVPTRRTTFGANSLRMEQGKLIAGFEHLHFEAVVGVNIQPQYMVFTLEDFIYGADSFGLGVCPILPPVAEFRLVQLPLIPRQRFGRWLNVLWDETVAVNVLSVCPQPRIGAEDRRDHKILYGETLEQVQLKGAGVALIVATPDKLLDVIDVLEQDHGLPRGVKNRRSATINRSYYWTSDIHPGNVHRHIEYAKKGGFSNICIFYRAFLQDVVLYGSIGDYGCYNEQYPNGWESLRQLLAQIKAAGISPGLHVLPSHIGMHSHYLTPKADHRIHLKKQFTLARPASPEDAILYVEERPENLPVYEKMRVLRFMGELICYESVSTEYPYCFIGCKRGYNGTTPRSLEAGTIGGLLDVSEFSANSAYVDQRNSLQDEIADGISKIYSAGFEFLYLDGAEGVNPPFDVNVGLAQWRVYRKLSPEPSFCEGAAKSHFSWHMLCGGNAFDIWSPAVFKDMIRAHPAKEAQQMTDDFTRVNFGWWSCAPTQRADVLEFGTAVAAGWDCPGALWANLKRLDEHPRRDDLLETLRRWEQFRKEGGVTPEVKARLRNMQQEHTLLLNESGELELTPWEWLPTAAGGDSRITAFLFERKGKQCAAIWHNTGSGSLNLQLPEDTVYTEQLGAEPVPFEKGSLPVDRKRYLITSLDRQALVTALANASLPAEE